MQGVQEYFYPALSMTVLVKSMFNCSRALFLYVHFLCLPKENEPKERVAHHLVPRCGTSLRCSKRSGAAKLASLRQSSRYSDLFCAARLRDMVVIPVPVLFFAIAGSDQVKSLILKNIMVQKGH